MKRILILGGGTGGLIIANRLAKSLRSEIARGEAEITLLDKNDVYVLEAGLPLFVFDQLSEEALTHRKRALLDPRVKAMFGDGGVVAKIDLANRAVYTARGKHEYDYLVVALGARYSLDHPPGIKDDYHTYYSLEGARELRDLLRGFQGGSIAQLVVMPDTPIKCPIAPGKSSLLLDSYLRYIRGIRGKTELALLTPADHLHAQPEVNKALLEEFDARGIKYIFNFDVSEINIKDKIIIASNGEKIKYDLLITVPLHRGPEAVAESGIGDPFGFVPADRFTLQYRRGKTHYDEVYVVGDVGGFGATRSGAVAHYEALVASHNISAEVKGLGDRRIYMGETICPMLADLYTPASKGRAWMPWWTYQRNADPFVPNPWGWVLMKLYYTSIELTLRGVI